MPAEGGNKSKYIVVTGALGFIGSCVCKWLEAEGHQNLLLVDDFSASQKFANIAALSHPLQIERKDFFDRLKNDDSIEINFFIHIGARTDTAETDVELFNLLNLNFTKMVWKYCSENKIPLIYASSAATYGNGEQGYADDHRAINKLVPLNAYGDSKNDFDKWALEQKTAPPFWYGLKFFNVYGPNEYHKGRMASVIMHAFQQFRQNGNVKLFRSHKNEYKDGEQLRDFIYVKDVADVVMWLMNNLPCSGIVNLGTGKARTFYDLVKATASAMEVPLQIEWIDIPSDIREKYQYFTEAKMDKLEALGYYKPFFGLEEGIADYVKNYLLPDKYA